MEFQCTGAYKVVYPATGRKEYGAILRCGLWAARRSRKRFRTAAHAFLYGKRMAVRVNRVVRAQELE